MNKKSILIPVIFSVNINAKYIAIDSDGEIWSYTKKPSSDLECWHIEEVKGSNFLTKAKPPEDWTKELYLIKDDGTLERVEK